MPGGKARTGHGDLLARFAFRLAQVSAAVLTWNVAFAVFPSASSRRQRVVARCGLVRHGDGQPGRCPLRRSCPRRGRCHPTKPRRRRGQSRWLPLRPCRRLGQTADSGELRFSVQPHPDRLMRERGPAVEGLDRRGGDDGSPRHLHDDLGTGVGQDRAIDRGFAATTPSSVWNRTLAPARLIPRISIDPAAFDATRSITGSDVPPLMASSAAAPAAAQA